MNWSEGQSLSLGLDNRGESCWSTRVDAVVGGLVSGRLEVSARGAPAPVVWLIPLGGQPSLNLPGALTAKHGRLMMPKHIASLIGQAYLFWKVHLYTHTSSRCQEHNTCVYLYPSDVEPA